MKRTAYTSPETKIVIVGLQKMIAASLGGTDIDGFENGGDANDGDGAGARRFDGFWDDEE